MIISFYPSAMAHNDSKWPKIETTKTIEKEYSNRLCEFFNSEDWKSLSHSGFNEIKSYNSKDIMFQHLSVKETVFNENKKRYEEINCFRNGHITQHLTSVDIEELVEVGSVLLERYERFISDNLEFNPFENFVIRMTE